MKRHHDATRPEPFEPTPIPEHHRPRRPVADLVVGESVWYRDQRYWLERVPESWDASCMVRISSDRILPDRVPPKDRVSFCVHADHVTKAPVTRNPYGRQPTKKAVDRREMNRKEGTRDNGDTVAVILRQAHTLDDVYRLTAKHLGVKEADLRAKYGRLNPGQQRMNCGNRLRGAHKRGLLKLN
ncbi:MAG: hypothetical protein BWY79_01338 [Actinobacteria bacterium ADurb.Bin444]|nr:MAG: hypothetical protein BWY79_01338 [Actinobacteria bacterium ADurb.Bin444]